MAITKIDRLDPRVREVVDELIRKRRATIEEITARLRDMLGEDEAPSQATVGRYVKRGREQMASYREAQDVAKVWIGKLDQVPEGDVGRLLSEMLRTVAFETLGELGGRGDGEVESREVMLLARAIRDLASADKLSTDRELKIRQELVRELDAKVDDEAKSGKRSLSINEIRAMIIGVYRD
jgi:hypothetical protein